MVGKGKPLKVNHVDVELVDDTCNVIVKQEHNLLSPQSTSSEHSSIDLSSSVQGYSICEEQAIIKYEDDFNNETTSNSNDKPDR